MDTLTYISTKYLLDLDRPSPIEIPNTGRDQLARLFHLLEFREGVEIGVEQGLYSEVLCRENPGVKLHCVDPWKAYRGYRDHVNQQKLDGFYEATRERLKPFPRVVIHRTFSTEAAHRFPDGSLDFVYIDGNHSFEAVTADLAAWTPKVRAGGIIAGHDFVRYKWPNLIHVVNVIPAWTEAYDIKPWFLLGSSAKVEGEIRDTSRSWFWVHPGPRSLKQRHGTVKQ